MDKNLNFQMKLYQLTPPLLFFITEAIAGLIPSSPISRNLTEPEPIDFSKITPSTELEWHLCVANFSCAVLDVPLDYAKPQGNRALVPLLKYSATRGPYQGILLTNPGGPGISAIDFLYGSAAALQGIAGGNYDIVAWEPRGLGYSTPLANCSHVASLSSTSQLQHRRDQLGSYIQDDSLQKIYKKAERIGEECQAATGGSIDAGPRMTTATVVRDMISILDAFAGTSEGTVIDNPKLLNYWGFSYGTTIGQTFASMFPSRVGRVALDGVVDSDDSSTGSHLTWLQSTDEAFSTFFLYCHLAGTDCAYFTGTSAHDIFLRFERTLSRLDPLEANTKRWENATAIGLALDGLKALSFQALYTPLKSFPQVAEMLVLVEQAAQNLTMDDIERLEKLLAPKAKEEAEGPKFVWQTAVSCTDEGNAWYNSTFEDVMARVEVLKSQSYIGGESVGKNIMACTNWGIKPDERFSGPFGGHTQNPMLFISNTRDPATPIHNGRRGSRLFQDAQLLTIDGTGHTSLNARNNCAFAKINAYFQNGTLPGKDSFCSLEAGPWNITITGGVEKRRDWKKLQRRMKALA